MRTYSRLDTAVQTALSPASIGNTTVSRDSERNRPEPGVRNERVRLDKWLWAARFFKTRALAAEAIAGGHVHTDGVRAKPSRMIAVGNVLEIGRNETTWQVVVRRISDRRGPAAQAQTLYEETERSTSLRKRAAEEKRSLGLPRAAGSGRPSKRDRRRM